MLWIMYCIIKIRFYQFFPCEPTFMCLIFIFRTHSELGKIHSFYRKVYYQIRVQIIVIPKTYSSVVAKKICRIVKYIFPIIETSFDVRRIEQSLTLSIYLHGFFTPTSSYNYSLLFDSFCPSLEFTPF